VGGCTKSRMTRNTMSRDNLIFSNFIRCASIKIQPACRLDIVIPLVPFLARERKIKRQREREREREREGGRKGGKERERNGHPSVVDQTPLVVEHLSSFRGAF